MRVRYESRARTPSTSQIPVLLRRIRSPVRNYKPSFCRRGTDRPPSAAHTLEVHFIWFFGATPTVDCVMQDGACICLVVG